MRAGAKTKTATALISKETTEMNASAKPSRRPRSGLIATLITAVALFAAAFVAPAQGAFGLHGFDLTYTNEDGTPATQAGSHPFALTTVFYNNASEVEPFKFEIDGFFKNLFIEQVRGFIGDATMPRCTTSDFAQFSYEEVFNNTACPSDTVVGVTAVKFEPVFLWSQGPVYNLVPPPGAAARLGFWVLNVPVTVDVTLKPGGEYNVVAKLANTPEVLEVFGAALQLWGVPADPGHDSLRGGACSGNLLFSEEFSGFESLGSNCSTTAPERPFLTLPRSCSGPATVNWETDSWEEPGKWLFGSSTSHDNAEPPNPQGFTGCGKLPFTPTTETDVGTGSAETGTGIDVSVDFNQEGIQSPDGLAQSEARKAVVTLPEGMTINPSVGEGLNVCTPADIDRETLASLPGEGCPNGSKLGDIQIDTPLVDQQIEGSIYLAQQDDPGTTTPGAENPFDSLIALYMVLKNPSLGVLVKLPMKVEPDPKTGQLVATLDNIPQVPFSHFNFHFKEGQRAPLVTPSACGTYTTKATFYPWSNPSQPRTSLSSFEVSSGLRGGSCPPGGLPPFNPHFEAGSVNNNAGAFSPFNMRLVREDGEQDMTKFSSILPPGVLGSLAGVSKCPDSAVDVAKAKTARQELASPSCPANSLIGHSLAGAGVGSALTYVPGQIYLGGPYKGDPLSVISITPALAGPFDAGTVVVRLALTLNPKTAEVEVDGANSDPIPHIVKGIVLKVRDLRVYVDRPNFTLNPTSCDESSAKATLFGSFLDVFSPLDDVPAPLSTRYQASNCLNLGFKPKLALNLKGGTKRGGHPGLSAIFTPRSGDANVEGLVVRLPRSAFLDQAHIRTICTRVQFAADACPPAAQYGYIKAWTPLLDEPLQGPVWLRSSDHKLPDLVFDLHGLVDIEVATRIDSAKGGIRASLEDLPDAPLSKVVLRMQGAKKGLIINSRDLCARKSKADVQLSGQNGKEHSLAPAMRAECGGKRKRPR
jgi:hypothetical protein